MVKGIIAVMFTLGAMCNLVAQNVFSHNTGGEQITIIPNPISPDSYFQLKVDKIERWQDVELVDYDGKRMNGTVILFSKMGLYMPHVAKGNYLLKITFSNETLIKEISVE